MPTDDHGAPVTIDQSKPHPARMYDWYLDGKDNYAADHEYATKVQAVFPTVKVAARTNRAFMHRATRFAAHQGIRQFLDIGTGIPTEPNLHQIAQAVDPAAHIVYVDNDPIVLTHARALMTSTPEGRTEYVHADVTNPTSILTAPTLLTTLDLTQPIALSLIALLHFVPDSHGAYDIVNTLLDALAPGSLLVLSHATTDFDAEVFAGITEIYRQGGIPTQFRSHAGFERFFQGLHLIDPGIQVPHRWRPDRIEPPPSMDARVSFYAAVARK